MSNQIYFFNEGVSHPIENDSQVIRWVNQLILNKSHKLKELNYIFCSDEFLLEINKEHLQHDYYTDIITFDMSENEKEIEADIFISIDRVKDNSEKHNTGFKQELYRVMAHGVLHLLGYNDKTEEEKIIMREKEDSCLSLLLEKK